jgi:hypothetical protein
MSNIIKNIFSNFGAKSTKKASIAKFCMICKNAFSKNDNAEHEFCADCIVNDRPSDMGHWQKFFAQQRANTLTPEMNKLADKLTDNNSLVEGIGFARVHQVASDRNIVDAKFESLKTSSLQSTKAKVEEILPKVLAEMGIDSRQIDASLLVDAIVPTKISGPILDEIHAKAALRSIVAEVLPNFNMEKMIRKEANVRTIGNPISSNDGIILQDVISRVSNEYGNKVRKIAVDVSELEINPNDESDVPTFVDKSEGDDKSQVHHLDDDEADQLVQEKSRATAPGASQDKEQDEEDQEMMPEGIGIEGEEPQEMPDYSDFMETPGAQGIVARVDAQEPDVMARKLEIKPIKKAKIEDTNIFKFASQINEGLPVQLVKIAEKQLNVIESYRPLNIITAHYNDNTSVAFKCYATDKGFLIINPDFTVHAKTISAFADFLSTDNGFIRLAKEDEISEKTNVSSENVFGDKSDKEKDLEEKKSVEDVLPETHVEEKSDEHDEEQEDVILEIAMEMLKLIEKMIPEEDEDKKEEMAITAALQYIAEESDEENEPQETTD